MEHIIKTMHDEKNGVPVKTVKSFLSKVPSVFTGMDLIQWVLSRLPVDDQSMQKRVFEAFSFN